MKIPLLEPSIGGNAAWYIEQCLSKNQIAQGDFIERFETEFAAYVGSEYAVACASGTAAIHVALRLLGVGPGDEVFCPTLTFVASANPIVYQGARPVFVDSERATWNMDPHLVVDALRWRDRMGMRQPKAVEVVHILGGPADITLLKETCQLYGVALFEDASEALGARYHTQQHVGTIGSVGCFSFNGNKIITTGGGGMLVTNERVLAKRARHLIAQARVSGAEYIHDEVGYNYRMSNITAALGVAQLEQLPEFLEKKRAIAERYDAALNPVEEPDRRAHSNWLYTIRRSDWTWNEPYEALADAGIESRPIWQPLHKLPMYLGDARVGGEVAERLADECLSLPSSVTLTEAQQDRVISVLTSALDRVA